MRRLQNWLSMEWKTVKLGDIVRRKIGYGIVQPGESRPCGVPVIKVNNIIAGLTSVDDLEKTTEEIESKYQRTRLQGGELIISLVGSVGNTAIVPKSFKGCNLVRATGLIDIEDPFLTKWVKYYIDSPLGQYYIKSNLNTTVQATLNVKSLVDMPIPMPDSRIIGQIAAILSSLDDKIENNNRINRNLEAQAQSLFKSWFVNFEPFGGTMPEDWREYELGEFLPVITGKKDANIASKTGKYPFFSCAQDILYTENYSFNADAILVAGNGDFNVKWYRGKFEAYQRTYVLIPNDSRYLGWLFYMVKHNLSNITCGARGSVIKFITKGNLENFRFAAPKDLTKCDIIDKFNVINQTIESKKAESQRLAALRDTLLPKLMKGKIEV